MLTVFRILVPCVYMFNAFSRKRTAFYKQMFAVRTEDSFQQDDLIYIHHPPTSGKKRKMKISFNLPAM